MIEYEVTAATVRITYAIPDGTAPEVRGTTCYLIPESVEWSVSVYAGRRHVHGYVEGRPSRSGRPRGRGGWQVPPVAPAWCPLPDDEWVNAAFRLLCTTDERVPSGELS